MTDQQIVEILAKHGIGEAWHVGVTPFPLDGEDAPLFIAAYREIIEAARSTIAAPAQHSDDATIDAAEALASLYDGDDRQDIKTDVMNAFYAGVKFACAAPASTAAPACSHRLADARNPVITSGYVCIDCGTVFAAADHDAARATSSPETSAPIQQEECQSPGKTVRSAK